MKTKLTLALLALALVSGYSQSTIWFRNDLGTAQDLRIEVDYFGTYLFEDTVAPGAEYEFILQDAIGDETQAWSAQIWNDTTGHSFNIAGPSTPESSSRINMSSFTGLNAQSFNYDDFVATHPLTPVPEPSTGFFLLTGLMVLCSVRATSQKRLTTTTCAESLSHSALS